MSEFFKSIDSLKRVKTYVSFRGAWRKCMTIDIPMARGVSMREINMRFNTSSFFEKKVSYGKFRFYLTYPKQFLRTTFGSGMTPDISKTFSVKCYRYEIDVGYMRVVRRSSTLP